MTDEVLVRAEHICKYFKIGGGRMLHAVEDVNLDIHRGETLGLVGESGCGKSTLGRTLMGIYQPTKGKLIYDGKPVDLSNKKDRFAFAKKAQIVFQDPYASLDPRMTVGSIIEEGMIIHNMYDAKRRQERVAELLSIVGLNREHANRFPHEFSGGQRQRIGIARSLAVKPKFVVCDEAVSALDVSIQSQIINLLADLKEQSNLTYLFITHDLSVVKYISDRIGVMYLGNMVELANTQELFDHPLHPYTEALMAAIPTTDVEENRELRILEGDIPSPVNPPQGCKFHTRCAHCTEICKHAVPEWKEMAPGHFVACHHPLSEKE